MKPLIPPRLAVALVGLLAATAAIQAQTIKPGLWESTSRMSGSPEMELALAQAQQMLANLPPEQRTQMEAVLAKQGLSVNLAAGKNGETTMRSCITKEMAERRMPPADPNCTYTTGKLEGSQQSFGFTCPGRGSGDGVVTFRSQTEAHTVMNLKADAASVGKGMAMKIESTGRFVAADCGDVKPVAMPK